MAITRVGLGGSRAAYGSFAGSVSSGSGHVPAPSRYEWRYRVDTYWVALLMALGFLHG